MNEIVLRNRQFGPEASLQLVEERAPNGSGRIEDVTSRGDLDTITASFSAAAGIDVQTVNTRRSLLGRLREHGRRRASAQRTAT